MSTEKSLSKQDGNSWARRVAEAVRPPTPTFTPAVDVYDNVDRILLFADLPGVAKEDLNVSFEKGEIAIEAKRSNPPTGALLAADFRPLDYRRTFALPSGIEAANITAELDRGVLRLTLPKAEALKPRRIEIKTG